MGAVNFDPSEFSEEGPAAIPAIPAIPKAKIAEIAEIATELSPEIQKGVARLSMGSPPMYIGADRWVEIVEDAQALALADPVAGYSMAGRAMSLGWDAKDLFGFWPAWQSPDDWISLAAWAQSRRVIVIGERTACLSSTEKTEAHFDRLTGRPQLEKLKYLWDI